MIKENTPSFLSPPFCRLPFKAGTFKVETVTLNQYTDFRIPKKPYLDIAIKKMAFEHEFWTLAVTIDHIMEQVYIKVTPTELLISCSVGTNESFLSRYAYCTVYRLMEAHIRSGFYDYYWPDLGGGELQKKFLKLLPSKTGLEVLSRDHLQGLFKPGQFLPKIEKDVIEIQSTYEPKPKKLTYDREKIISYNLLATPFYHFRAINHFPFLIPYQGILNKAKTTIKLFTRHIFDYTKLSAAYKLSPEEKQLNEICFSMITLATVRSTYEGIAELSEAEIRQLNIENFTTLFKLWKLTYPLLHLKDHTYHFYTRGMQEVSENPVKSRLTPCTFNNSKVELCILWKEHPDHYALELLVWIEGKAYQLPNHFDPFFFVATAEKPNEHYLLNSITDCSVLAFFAETDYKLLVLKLHYDMYFKLFEDQLRTVYKFINRK
uniref:hypothetical protein n=1 Tax=Pedobacter schmidteae TaxID=2201271 RepID=UPI000EB19FE6|nr:hypothetical protein [Pedobacter schmidteae]